MTDRHGVLYLTTRVGFSAAHQLTNPEWTEAHNREVFHECARPHGHDYALEVTVRGAPDPRTGMVIDLKELKRRVRAGFSDRVDHRDLNRDLPALEGRIPTAENLVTAAWFMLEPLFPEPAVLHRLRLYETDRSFVETFGPAAAAGDPERNPPS